MNPFLYNQSSKDKFCGWRCLYHLIPEQVDYTEFLGRFKYFSPGEKGITFSSIVAVLDYYKMDYVFTAPTKPGTYLIWSAVGKDGKEWAFEGGHYFIYRMYGPEDGTVFDTLQSESYDLPPAELMKRIETKEAKKSFTCLRVSIKDQQ